MSIKKEILSLASSGRKIKTDDIVSKYKVSRQYVNTIINPLVKQGVLTKVGSTKNAFYISPKHRELLDERVVKRLENKNLKDYEVFEQVDRQMHLKELIGEDLHSILYYAFTEMMNNAMDHSESKNIQVEIGKGDNLYFYVNDVGIGVFRNIMKKRGLKNELEAIQDLLKGKMTTMPQAHSGEGIFFTSKIADVFVLESFNLKLTIDNRIKDVFLEELKPSKKGTKVYFSIAINSKKHLEDVFKKYHANPEDVEEFDKTEILIKLYTKGTIHISRSQAKRVTVGLEKFKLVILDFDQVPTIGQAFADEIFRVFQKRHPNMKIVAINMNEAVQFMVERVKKI